MSARPQSPTPVGMPVRRGCEVLIRERFLALHRFSRPGSLVVHFPNDQENALRNCNSSRISFGRMAALFVSFNIYAVSAGSLTGTWLANGARSTFGAGAAPEKVSVRLERKPQRLIITEVTTDADGDHLSYRAFSLNRNGLSKEITRLSRDAMVLNVISAKGVDTESWQLSRTGELHIRRELITPSGTTHQHLVLRPAATRRADQ